MTITDADAFLSAAQVQPEIWDRHPDYVAALIVVTDLNPGPSSDHSDALLHQVETSAAAMLGEQEPHGLAEIAVWREAYLGMGLKPREARSSVEALIRRTPGGLPRINRLTDVYNAISVRHLTPIGGEDLTGYVGAPRLVVAQGDETFDSMMDGQPVMQQATAGEIVWRDEQGVTCRRWNWRQCVRTRLTESTTEGLFIIDALGANAAERAHATAEDLVRQLAIDSPSLAVTLRVLAPQKDGRSE